MQRHPWFGTLSLVGLQLATTADADAGRGRPLAAFIASDPLRCSLAVFFSPADAPDQGRPHLLHTGTYGRRARPPTVTRGASQGDGEGATPKAVEEPTARAPLLPVSRWARRVVRCPDVHLRPWVPIGTLFPITGCSPSMGGVQVGAQRRWRA